MSPGPSTAADGLRRAAVLLAAGLVLWVYSWTARPFTTQLPAETAKQAYYNLLVDGFRAGQLSLKVEPHPEMARLANPYDPEQNGPYRLHDATYYQGKYYIYFGVTPAVVLFLPYTMLTGEYLWHRDAVLVFCALGFLAMAGLLCAARRRYFPSAGAVTMAALTLGLGLTNGMPMLLRRPDVWEVPIACATMFVTFTFVALWGVLHDARRRVAWTAAASLAFGLALGARPSLLLGAGMLLLPIAVFRWRGELTAGGVVQLLLGAVLPVTLVGCGLMYYNWARFGSVAEFGQKYQLTGVDNTHQAFFGAQYFWYHLRLYLWEPAEWMRHFPFVAGIHVPPPPPGQLGVEGVFGVLTNLPLAWLAVLGGRSATTGSEQNIWRGWIAVVVWQVVFCGLTICLFGGATNRYYLDFLPGWILLAAFGILALEHRLARCRPLAKVAGRALWGGVLVYSIAFAFCFGCGYLGLLRAGDPAGYARLAHGSNTPVAWAERLVGVRYGPIELRIELPPFAGVLEEPLISAGPEMQADSLWIRYEDPTHIRLVLKRPGRDAVMSESLSVEGVRVQQVVASFGFLYPPAEHPFFNQMDAATGVFLRQLVCVKWNGVEVLRGERLDYEAAPWERHVGGDPRGGRFSGRILSRHTLDWKSIPRPAPPPPGGRALLEVRLPAGRPAGSAEPLMQTGVTGRADTLYVKYADAGQIVLGFDHWGRGAVETPPLPVDYAGMQRIEVHFGSWAPAGTAPARRLEVRLNGVIVLEGDREFHHAEPWQVHFGLNPAGASTAAPSFGGRIESRWLGPER